MRPGAGSRPRSEFFHWITHEEHVDVIANRRRNAAADHQREILAVGRRPGPCRIRAPGCPDCGRRGRRGVGRGSDDLYGVLEDHPDEFLKNAMLQILVLASGLAAAVVIDVRTRRIPNWLTAALAAAGLGMAFAGGGVSPRQAALGLVAGLLLMMPSHLIGATGAGDVKLMAAVGTVLGPGLVLRAFLFTVVAGGVLALAVAARRGRLADTLHGTAQLVIARDGRQTIEAPHRANRFAYGPAIAIGTLVSMMVTS